MIRQFFIFGLSTLLIISCEQQPTECAQEKDFVNSISIILLHQHNGEVSLDDVAKAYDYLESVTTLKSNVLRDPPFIYQSNEDLILDVQQWILWYKENDYQMVDDELAPRSLLQLYPPH